VFKYIEGSQVPKASPEVKISAQKKGLPPQKGLTFFSKTGPQVKFRHKKKEVQPTKS
jgi:hypothetical protein